MIWYDSLMKPLAYPHPVGEIRHLATHISDVFLTGTFAYKIKKPVDLKFLDFSTLDKRRTYCEREVALNRRLAPEIYLGVVPITREGDHFRVEGSGEPVEYAVKMIQFEQAGLLDAMAERGEVTSEHIISLADQVARFHASAERADAFGTPETIGENVLRNFEQTEKYVGRVVSADLFRQLREYSEHFLAQKAFLFQQRAKRGAIRVCHGDLHLQNICLHRGRLIIFDCIEFNDVLNHIDVINEIAFLLMDLDHRGLTGLDDRFLNAYLEKTQDYEGLRLMDFYLAYRACVRAKVACYLVGDPDLTDVEKSAARDRAASYFELAGSYLEAGRPGLVLMAGVSGTGKSTVGTELAVTLHGVIIRSDAVRKSIAGRDPGTHTPEEFTRGLYAPEITDRTYDVLLERAESVIASGRWAILDATYTQRRHRREARSWAETHGVPMAIVHCTAPVSVLEARIAKRTEEGRDVSDAGVEIMRQQLSVFEPFDEAESGSITTVETAKEWEADQIREELFRRVEAAS